MFARIVDWSLDSRPVVIVLWVLVALLGLASMRQLPIDAVPDVTNVQVQILTDSPGLAPPEVERFVTFPVETAMSGLPAVEEVRSVSKFGLSVVTVVFEDGTDLYWARQLVAERLTEARESIPEGYGSPEMGPISTGLGEIYQFEVRGEGHSPMELRSILDWQIAFQLRSVPGVVEVNSFGGELKTYQVTLLPDRLVAYDLTLAEVFEAIESNNANAGGGYIAHAGEQYLVRGEGLVEGLDDLGAIVVAHDEEGTPIRVRDLGKAEFAPMIRQGAVTRDGQREAVIGIVMMLMGANSRTVAAEVDAKVRQIEATLPPGVTIDTFYDRQELVDRTIRTVATNLIEGGLLVVLVLLLLLGSLPAGLLVAAAIPLSMLAAFTAMRWAGLSGNLMSLGAIDFGLIVDGSVVIVENVMRRLFERRDGDRLGAVRAASREVARPVAFAVGVIIIVYLPILALSGIEGRMFRPMALTVVFALTASLVCALTLMPALSSLLLRPPKQPEPLLARWAHRLYAPVLGRVLRRPLATAAVALAAFAGSLAFVPLLGAEFVPRLDEGAIAMQIWRLPSVSLEESNRISLAAERVVRRFPEVETVVSRTGRAEIATDPMGVEISDTYLILEPRDTWRFDSKEALVAAIDAELQAALPGVVFSYSQPIELRVAELISGVRSDVAVKVFAGGAPLERMHEVARRIAAVVAEVPGMVDVKAEQVTGLPFVRVRLDRAAIARLGINAEDVLDVVETIGGKRLGTVFEGQERYALQARFVPTVRDDLHALRELKIGRAVRHGGDRVLVPLAQVADVGLELGPAQISRERISRRTTVEANVRGRDLATAVAEARERVRERVDLPPGWTLEWGGQFENLQQAAGRLSLLVPVALGVIFVLLYGALRSTGLALLIFLNVPMAVTGGVLALLLRGYPFSISAAVGFIALFGIAVLNGVVLVSTIVALRREGVPGPSAARQAALRRLRPVLMTALVASLGFLPMALATSAGAEVQRPLATVVIGGLVTSTLLTLLVLPALYARAAR